MKFKGKWTFLVIVMVCMAFLIGCHKEPKPTSLKIKVQDTYLGLIYMDDKPYLSLEDFGAYLNPSKHRYYPEINEEKKNIKLKSGFYLTEDGLKLPEKLVLDSEEKVEGDKVTYRIQWNKTKEEYELLSFHGKLYISLEDAKKLFQFDTTVVEIAPEKGEVTDVYYEVAFQDEDEKELSRANNRDYDWYMDQAHTGEWSDGNCGPTSVAMVMKWLDETTEVTGESVRNEDPNDGDWWNTNMIEDYFRRHKVSVKEDIYLKPEVITDMIDEGRVVLVCIVMSEIKPNLDPDTSNKGRFYGFDGGHFLLIKGYKVEDGILYYEVYDPNNWDQTYSESGEPMGKDRLYPAHEMEGALKNWWMTVYGIEQ